MTLEKTKLKLEMVRKQPPTYQRVVQPIDSTKNVPQAQKNTEYIKYFKVN